MRALLSGKEDFTEVSSLTYRGGDGIRINPAPKYALSLRNTIPDLSFIDGVLDVYAENYRAQFGHLHAHEVRPVTVNNARGCENGYKRCTYCSIAELAVNTGDPRGFWKTVDQYNRATTASTSSSRSTTASPPAPATWTPSSTNKTTGETNLEAIRMLHKAGISVHASYIAGAPGERPETLDRTIAGIRQMLG